MSTEPKRGDDRVTINKEFESFDAFIQEYVTNISRTGVFIRSTNPLAIGTRVNLHFTVIMRNEHLPGSACTGPLTRNEVFAHAKQRFLPVQKQRVLDFKRLNGVYFSHQ